jgi:hypothetical protein
LPAGEMQEMAQRLWLKNKQALESFFRSHLDA